MDSDSKLIACLVISALALIGFGVYCEVSEKQENNKLVAESCKTMNLAIKINDSGIAECFKP